MIELALHHARNGYPVFPLVPNGKVPVIPSREGGRGCKDATTNEARINQWWGKYPDANIGIATGKLSGLVVIDVDVKNGKPGLESINQLKPPPTFTVRTPTRGFHLYYRHPPGVDISIGTDLLPGIDWRGDGGYVVAAGSVTADGIYSIGRQLAIAPLPDRIAQLIAKAKARPVVSAGKIPEGRRDDTLLRMACALRRFGVDAAAIHAALRGLNSSLCEPPLPDQQLQRIAQSAAKYPPRSVA